MSGIGGIIHWDKRAISLSQIWHMMNMVSHRGPDGIWVEAREQVGLGFALLAIKKSDMQHLQPVWLPDQSMAVAADATLYNRQLLAQWLKGTSWWQDEPSDAAILLAAYERWGLEMLHYIEGDFAFAIWDGKRQQVFAARDPFSARPFFYFHDDDRFLFGSEPKQLLTQPGVVLKPDGEIVWELLNRKFSRLEKTFFEGIWRLKPAHFLIARADSIVQTRWWDPDSNNEIWCDDPQAYYDGFRELLKWAIARRLDSDFPAVAELSGGFDSSSIVVLADEIRRQYSTKLPAVETISYFYPNDACDESAYIKEVLDQVAFTSNGCKAVERAFTVDELKEEVWRQDSPFFIDYPAHAARKGKIIAGADAKIQLSGIGGDEVALLNYEEGDLIRHGKIRAFAQLSRRDNKTPFRAFSQAILESAKVLVPSRLPMKPSLKPWRFRSIIQNKIFDDFTEARFHWLVESNERQSSWYGYESRHPFCDQPLVEFILAMPIEQRLKGEQYRFLQRRGLRHLLPAKILNRDDKMDFLSYHKRVFTNELSQLQQYLFTSDWLSEPYTSRDAAEKLFKTVAQSGNDYNKMSFSLCLSLACLETWLRGFNRYYQERVFGKNEAIETFISK